MRIDILKKISVSRKYIALFVLGIIALVAILINWNTNKEKLALEYFYTQQYDKAIEEYKKLASKEPGEGLWDAKIAEIYYLIKDNENCKLFLENAKNKKDKNGDTANTILFVSIMNSNYNKVTGIENTELDKVLDEGNEYLKKFPENKQLYQTMMLGYLVGNKYDNAVALVEQYPTDVNSATDLSLHGSMYLSLGDYDKAFKRLEDAYKIDSDEMKIYDVLAQGYQYDKDTIIKRLLTLSEENSSNNMYKLYLSKIYSLENINSSKSLEILKELEGELKDQSKSLQPNLIKLMAFENSGQVDEAKILIENLISKHKKDYRVNHAAAWYYYKVGEYEKAQAFAQKSIEENKDYVDNYGFLIPEILKNTKEGEGAEPYLYTSVKLEPFNNNLHINKGYYYWDSIKDSVRAVESLNIAKTFQEESDELSYNIALIYLANNNFEQAIDMLIESVTNKPEVAKYHRTLSTAYILTGKNAEGFGEVNEAYKLDNTDILILNNMACYYLTVEGDLDKSLSKIAEAYSGLKEDSDEYVKATIQENYNKVMSLNESYKNGADNEILEVPDLTMFY